MEGRAATEKEDNMEITMFTFRYNVTGPERKRLVEAIAEIHGGTPHYLGAPTFAYAVDYFTISRDGAVSFDDRADSEEIEKLAEALAERGFVAEAAQEPNVAPQEAALPEDASQSVETGESAQEAAVGETCGLWFPRADMTDAALENLRKLVDSKAALIRKALDADSLEITVTDERISFPWFSREIQPEDVTPTKRFLERLIAAAKEHKRVTARERKVDNEKYAFRCFLLRLGFIGAEYKAERKALLRNLTGSAAFKSGDHRGKDEQAKEG